MLTTIAAILFTALAAFVVAFQLALVAGARWGEMTLGGRYKGALPKRMRIAALFSAMLLAGFVAIVLARAELALIGLRSLSSKLVWAVAAYCLMGSVLNYITPSKRERALWFPVVVAMLICCLCVAFHDLLT